MATNTSKTLPIIVHVLLPMLLGASIYVFLREQPVLFIQYLPALQYLAIESSDGFYQHSWVLFNLPDGLWLYSFTSFLCLVWADRLGTCIVYCLLALAVAVGSEMLQRTGQINGTYDPVDILSYCVGFFLALIISGRPLLLIMIKKMVLDGRY